MLEAFCNRLGKRLLRLGLRLLGWQPGKTLMFYHTEWNARQMAECAIQFAFFPSVPKGMVTGVPDEIWDEFEEVLAERMRDVAALESALQEAHRSNWEAVPKADRFEVIRLNLEELPN
jgi:hypothetical protein